MPLIGLVSLLLILPSADLTAFGSEQSSSLPRVFVTTAERGDGAELSGRQQSVKDLRAALTGKKKTLTVVDQGDRADITIEVMERTTTVPRIRIGLATPGGPSRSARLRVKLTRGEGDPVEFTNKNTAFEDQRGWQAAADDIAKQIEKWIFGHLR